jgi:hypothetical protein
MDEASRAKRRAAEQLHERARQFRGRFLNHVAVIERDIALLLTSYFCTDDPSKQAIFFNNIASAMSLNAKRSVLVEIVKKDYPRYWDEHSQFLLDLQRLQEFRNKLAHSVVDVSDTALARPLDLGVGFVQWKKGEPITENEFDDWVVRANMVLGTLDEIKMLLPFKERPHA